MSKHGPAHLLTRWTKEDEAAKKLLEYAGDIGTLEKAVGNATLEFGGIPDLDTLLRHIGILVEKKKAAYWASLRVQT